MRTAERLHLLHDLPRGVTTSSDPDALLRDAARRTRELLEAEGCAVLLLDARRGVLFSPVASQVASGKAISAALEEISFPAHKGIAGWVLQHDEAAAARRPGSRFLDGPSPAMLSGANREDRHGRG